MSIKFIQKLSKKEYFGELEFAIYGTGKFFNSLTNKIKGYSNIKIKNNFLTQDEVAKLHNQYGIFLCPTRQDAQGVSMCEAMSSGLIPLTSNNTAIPEFVQNKTEGLLCNNEDISSFVEAYETLYNNPEIFSKMSKNASLRMDRQCSLENTILEEIKYIEDK